MLFEKTNLIIVSMITMWLQREKKSHQHNQRLFDNPNP